MASHRNAFSSLIHVLDPDLYTGFHFCPTYEEGIRIVNIKNTGGELAPIFYVYGYLFQCLPEQLEECYCFTKLKLLGKNKVDRTLGDDSGRYWKNTKPEVVTDGNKNSIGCVTKLVLHWDKETPTEWHIVEYRDTKMPVDGRYVLCHVYKLEKKNDSGRGDENQAQCSNTQPDWVSIAATNPQDALAYSSQQLSFCPNQIDDFEGLFDDEFINNCWTMDS